MNEENNNPTTPSVEPQVISPTPPPAPIAPAAPVTPQAPVAPEVPPVTPMTPVTPVTPMTPVTPVAPQPDFSAMSANSAGNSKKPLLIIGIVVGLVLLIAAMVGGVYVYAGSAANSYKTETRAQVNDFITDGNKLSADDADGAEFAALVEKYQAQAPKLVTIPGAAMLNPKYKQAQQAKTEYEGLMADQKTYQANVAALYDFSTQLADQIKDYSTAAEQLPNDPSTGIEKVNILLVVTEEKIKKADTLPNAADTQPIKEAYVNWLKVYQEGLKKVQADPSRQTATKVATTLGAADVAVSRNIRNATNTATDKLGDQRQALRDRRSALQDALQ